MNAFTESVTCPICGNRRYRVIREARYPTNATAEDLATAYCSSSDLVLIDQLVACRGCELVYLNPRARADLILRSYSDAVDPVFFEQNPHRIRTFRKALSRLSCEIGMAASPDRCVLDVGCAGGAFPKAAADLGFSVVGIEPSAWLCERGRQEYGLDLRAGVLSEQHFDDESFDLVTLWDVIEHLTDPKVELGRIHRLLKRDGYLIVNYPDYASLARRLLRDKWPFLLSVHLYYFTPTTITALLARAGFTVVRIRPYWQTLALGYVLRRVSAYSAAARAVGSVVRTLGLEDTPCTYQMGQSLVVARKDHVTAGI